MYSCSGDQNIPFMRSEVQKAVNIRIIVCSFVCYRGTHCASSG